MAAKVFNSGVNPEIRGQLNPESSPEITIGKIHNFMQNLKTVNDN